MSLSQGFGAGQASRLARVSYKVLDYWDKSGFLSPSLEAAAGTGTRRLYSFADVIALRVAGELRGAGISLQALRKVIAYLRQRGSETFSDVAVYLVSDGVDVFERRGDEVLSLLCRPGQRACAWILDLGRIVQEVKQDVAEAA